jgi:multiple sugar transport system substrate-binding protein
MKKGFAAFLCALLVISTAMFANGGQEAADDGPIILQVWHGSSGGAADGIQLMVDDFNASRSDIQVELVFVDVDTMVQRVTASIAANTPPDIGLLFWPAWVGPLSSAIQPLNEYIAADPSGYDESDFADNLLDGNSVHGGVVYGMPVETNNLAIYYNKDLFRQAGVTELPETWEELVEVGQAISAIDDRTWGLELPTGTGDWTTWIWQTFLWQAGGSFANPDTMELEFNSPEGVKALQFWVDLIHTYGVAALTPPENGFNRGNIGMTIAGPWRIPTYLNQTQIDFGIFPLPADEVRATNIGGTVNVMFRTDEARQQAAWEFLKHMSSPSVSAYLGANAGFIPVRKSSIDDPVWVEYAAQMPDIQVHIDAYEYGNWRPYYILTYNEITEIVSSYIQSALYQQLSPEDALQAAYDETRDLVEGWD